MTKSRNHGIGGERIFQKYVRNLLGKEVDGYIASSNIYFQGQYFEIDFLVFLPEFGFILAETKYYNGIVGCNGSRVWPQNKNHVINERGNSSKQVLRTRAILKKLLKKYALDKWKIHPVVVFTHPNSSIALDYNDKPQTDVIILDEIGEWMKNLPRNKSVRITKDQFFSVRDKIESYSKQYERL